MQENEGRQLQGAANWRCKEEEGDGAEREMQLRDVGKQESKGEKERGLSFGIGERARVQRGCRKRRAGDSGQRGCRAKGTQRLCLGGLPGAGVGAGSAQAAE